MNLLNIMVIANLTWLQVVSICLKTLLLTSVFVFCMVIMVTTSKIVWERIREEKR